MKTVQNVLVTGANGFVGQHLVRELLSHDKNVVAIGGPGKASAIPDIEYLSLDLTQPEQASQIDFSKIDAVIHLAGLSAMGPSFDKPMQYVTTNIGMETNLFEAARAQNCFPRFLVVSSATLYDAKSPMPLTEQSAVVSNSPYSVSKIGQEQMAFYYHGRGFETINARPFNHIGPGQDLGFIVPDFAKQLIDIQAGKASKLLVGNLEAQRDYTDARDIARAYRLLIEKGTSGETYNICSGTPLNGHAILEGLQKAAGLQVETQEDPTKMRPSDTPIHYGDHQKISDDTGWQPEILLATTLADVVADWRSRTA
jgi:GDP-4-dehydro-6-deoxy-D-mannose reductase